MKPPAAGGGKMNKSILLFAILAMILLLFASCSCNEDDDGSDNPSADVLDDDDDDDDDDSPLDDDDDAVQTCDHSVYDPLIVQGKQSLSSVDSQDGYASFASALLVCPDKADAKIGMLIAQAQWLSFWLADAIENPPVKGVTEDLQTLFDQELLPVSAEMLTLADDLLTNHQNARFYVAPLPFVIDEGHLLFDLGGEWDIHDIANAKSYARLWEGVGRFLIAFNLPFDEALFANNPPPAAGTLFDTLHHYTGLFLDMYDDPAYSDFLTLAENGSQNLADAATHLGLGFSEIKTNFMAMRTETDSQYDDIAGYVDANENGQWDEGETFKVPYLGELPVGTNSTIVDLFDLLEKLGYAFLDTGPEDPHRLLPDWFNLAEFNFILEYTDVIDPDNPIRLPSIPIPIGRWFYNVDEAGWKPFTEHLLRFINGVTAPVAP
jgi:hypothetical protein